MTQGYTLQGGKSGRTECTSMIGVDRLKEEDMHPKKRIKGFCHSK